MLGYILLALCVFGTLTCGESAGCYSLNAQKLSCEAECSAARGLTETYDGECSGGLACCADILSACLQTQKYAWSCGFFSFRSACKYRAKRHCDQIEKAPAPPPPPPTPPPPPPPTVQCGTKGVTAKRSTDKRVVGGEFAEKCEFPWQAYVSVVNALCGGSIVDEYTIVTAAHCIQPSEELTAGNISVRVGEHDLTNRYDHTEMKVKSFQVHERYNSQTYQNDIAIVKLEKPIQFDDKCVKPICLPAKNQDFTGQSCEVSGWGTTSSGGNIATTLKKVTLPLYSQWSCAAIYGTDYITDMNLCAGLEEGGKDACQGDSGGPMVCPQGDGGYVLAGVVSWGIGCADPGRPGIYADVTEYLDWIETTSKAI